MQRVLLPLAAALAVFAALAAAPKGVPFTDITRSAGITFEHDMGRSGRKMMVETMGSGGGFLDYDNDGDLDIYLVNGAPLPGYLGTRALRDALYRNEGSGRFTDVTTASRTGDPGYGMGICAGDYDNDGFTDLYVANFGPDTLYRNAGDGTFNNVTASSGTGDPLWGSSCAFFDPDRDGDLDLYVANYVDFSVDNDKFCGDYAHNVKAYCHPNVYTGEPDSYYRNNGDGTFTESSASAGLTSGSGNGLGVVTADFDADGHVDLFIANDKSSNILYRNDGKGRFSDVTMLAGVGYSLEGQALAGMGTDFGDYDGDGDLDLVVTNLDFENNSLYRNEGDGLFSDMSFPSGIGAVSLSFVGFGADFADLDNDGRQDLAIANGHILDNAAYFNDATTYAQRNFLFLGQAGGKMAEVGLASGADMAAANVGRGLATGDMDADGDLDMLITVCGGAPRLLRNDSPPGRHWIALRLVGKASNRSALGARVTARGPAGPLIDEVRSGGSYLSQGDLRIHFGLGETPPGPLELDIRWPSGAREKVKVPGVDRAVTLVEGAGAARP